jgi:hypothetical protein
MSVSVTVKRSEPICMMSLRSVKSKSFSKRWVSIWRLECCRRRCGSIRSAVKVNAQYHCCLTTASTAQYLHSMRHEIAKELEADADWVASPLAKQALGKAANVPSKHIHCTEEVTGMQDYLRQRGFELTTQSESRILSSLTTFPLTVAHSLHKILARPDLSPTINLHGLNDIRICVVGARAESSLPVLWWRECLFSCPSHITNISLVMQGPHLQGNNASNNDKMAEWKPSCDLNSVSSARSIRISLLKKGNCPLHLHPRIEDIVIGTDMFVLFNPGLGATEELRKSWKETILLMLRTHKPIVFTSHGEADMKRDWAFINELCQEHISESGTTERRNDSTSTESKGYLRPTNCMRILIEPTPNKFASEKRTFDEKEIDECKVVTNSAWLYALHGSFWKFT